MDKKKREKTMEEGGIDVREVMVMEDYREPDSPDGGSGEEGPYPREQWEAIVEAVLFTMGQSVELRQLAAALGQSEKTAADVARQLKERYDREKRGLQIIALDDSYQMCTRVEYYENLIRVASAPKKHAH